MRGWFSVRDRVRAERKAGEFPCQPSPTRAKINCMAKCSALVANQKMGLPWLPIITVAMGKAVCGYQGDVTVAMKTAENFSNHGI